MSENRSSTIEKHSYKFGHLVDGAPAEYTYPGIFAQERTSGPDRLVIAPSSNQIGLMLSLLAAVEGPYGLLYILLVPRGEGEAGRLQSPQPLSREQVECFIRRFAPFFEHDARMSFWIASTASSAMLVYDHHNVIYAYGDLNGFRTILSEVGISEVPAVSFPAPHTHNYNSSYDVDAAEILHALEWIRTPLRDTD